MTENDKYIKALEFATEKHKGQYRRGGIEYITHPIAVAEMLKERNYGIDYQLAGLFHDLLEDTDATEDEIEGLGGKDVLEAVKLVTKTKGYDMAEYIANIKKNPMAMAVKACDRLHNLQCATVCEDAFKRKYIEESKKWYCDFDDGIIEAVRVLEESLKECF